MKAIWIYLTINDGNKSKAASKLSFVKIWRQRTMESYYSTNLRKCCCILIESGRESKLRREQHKVRVCVCGHLRMSELDTSVHCAHTRVSVEQWSECAEKVTGMRALQFCKHRDTCTSFTCAGEKRKKKAHDFIKEIQQLYQSSPPSNLGMDWWFGGNGGVFLFIYFFKVLLWWFHLA